MATNAPPHDTAFYQEVYDLLELFFDPLSHWGGMTHDHLAYRALQERYPDLSPRQTLTLIIAAKRVFAASRAITRKE